MLQLLIEKVATFLNLSNMMSGRKQPIFARQQWGVSAAAAAKTSKTDYGYKID